ncbi:ligand-binding sensor domain-containing protein [Algibacillus agarilyticus]|uniref:ligand-binding sensor domain-containing protein n=1 Tax=Algibacillus agarilyticus TaxID=2234133 RepID=UPI0013008695|nr:hypothetical protein [Algibacillus agarilyticus]
MCLTFIILSTLSFCSTAQESRLFSYSDIYDIEQDQNGTMWFARQSGLYQYDGVEIRNVLSALPDRPFDWAHQIATLNNQVYVATEKSGVWQVDVLSRQAELLLSYDIVQHSVEYVAIQQEQLLALTKSQLFYYQLNDKSFRSVDLPEGHWHLLVSDKLTYIYSGTEIYQVLNEKLTRVYTGPINSAILVDDELVIASLDQLCKLQSNSPICIATAEPILNMLPSRDPRLFWTITENNVLQARLKLTLAATSSYAVPITQGDFVHTLFEDEHAVLWIAGNSGLYKYTADQYEPLDIQYDNPVKYNYMTLFTHDHSVYLGSYGAGVYQIDTQTKLSQAMPLLNAQLPTPYAKRIAKILMWEGLFYIITFDGVYTFSLETKVLLKIDATPSDVYLTGMITDDILYVGSNHRGILRYDLNSAKWLSPINRETHQLPANEIIDIYKDERNRFWYATSQGLVLDRNNRSALQVLSLPTTYKYICITESYQKMYVGTLGDGVLVLDHEGKIINQFLAGKVVYGFTLKDNDLWVSTQSGLYRVNTMIDEVHLVNNTENWDVNASVAIVDNMLYVPTMRGLIRLPIASQSASNPNVIVSSVTTIRGIEYNVNDVFLESSKELISLRLAVLDFRNLGNHKFRYRIGQNKWQIIAGNTLSLTGLESGEHILEIQGTDSLGYWSAKDVLFKITVQPLWYLSKLSLFIYAGAIFAMLVSAIWYFNVRAHSLRSAKKLIHSELLLKQKTDSLINLNLKQIKALTEEPINEDTLAQIAELTQVSLQQLAIKNRQGVPDTIGSRSIETAVPILVDYLEREFNCKVNAQVTLPESLEYEMQADIYRALYEIAHLSIFEARSRNIDLVLRYYNEKIWLICHDDGANFSKLNTHINIDVGMLLLKQIADKYQSRLEFSRRKSHGNSITLAIHTKISQM